jgi:hypothetical protein
VARVDHPAEALCARTLDQVAVARREGVGSHGVELRDRPQRLLVAQLDGLLEARPGVTGDASGQLRAT